MGNKYNPQETEEKIRRFWEKDKTYKFDPKRGKAYSIDTPPPYLSGKMHIGHSFSYSQEDFIARYQRMKGNLFYPFGTDDNGLPTERYVEKMNNIKSKSMSRAKFVELCLKTLRDMTPDFISDYKKLGISCDYEIYYSTIDKHAQKVSQKSFIDLYKQKDVYKNEFPTLWCPECQTTIAQAELDDLEKDSKFVFIDAEVEDGSKITYATTRPELLHACVCISVHKDDKRYKKFVGKKAKIPISNEWVPIIVDEHAKMDFGTGVVYWCPYGDKNDVEFLARHPEFTPKPVLAKDGTLNDNAKEYSGMRVKQARNKIIEDLEKAGAVNKIEPIHHVANVHDKCGTEIEFITTDQWFIKVLDKKKELIKRGKSVNWYPKFMYKRYENWVNGLQWDWSISRERHFGVPIPVWECKDCNEIILPEDKELPVDPLETKKKCPKCNKQAKGEDRVLDTWATSSMTPQITSELVNGKIGIPFSMRPQAHDIIRTWAFYTIAKSHMHENSKPWEDIMVSGYVTLGGDKMSKSKGTGIQPKKLLEEYGADALRFWAAGSNLGNDLDYQEKDLITGKKTITKLWNATNFVFMNLNDYKNQKPKKLEEVDQLFLNKLNDLVKKCTDAFEKYEYSKVKSEVDRFFWNAFAANYLEVVKKRVYQGSGNKRLSAQYTLYQSLLTILKLLAPIMPFVTEEIYQTYYKKNEKGKSIHLERWPSFEKSKGSENFDVLMNLVSKVRQVKSEKQKPMNSEIILTISRADKETLKDMLQDLTDVTNAQNIIEGKFKVEVL